MDPIVAVPNMSEPKMQMTCMGLLIWKKWGAWMRNRQILEQKYSGILILDSKNKIM